jgi:hypothetical protein
VIIGPRMGVRTFAARISIVAMTALAFGITLAPATVGAKTIGGFIGGPSGSAGAQFGSPRGIAVSESGAGAADAGDIYVAEPSNRRVQVLDSEGNFKRVWGGNVISLEAPGDLGNTAEICIVAADCQIGAAGGIAGGFFDNPQGVALNQTTGDVYVTERGNRRVQQFDAAGNFIRAFGKDVGGVGVDVCTSAASCQTGTNGTGAGQFATATNTNGEGIAVSPVAPHDVFVADVTNRRINQYEADGDFIRAWGYGVDTGAAQFQVCTAASTCQAGNAAGTANGQLSNNNPLSLTIDSQNVVYATDTSSGTSANRIVRFDADLAPVSPGPPFPEASGALLGLINPTGTGGPLLATTTAAAGIEIDPDTDGGGSDEESLLVVRDPNTPTTANTVVQELDVPTTGGELPADPITVVGTHTFAAAAVNGLGVDPVTENILLPFAISPPGHGLFVLVEAPGVSEVFIELPSPIGATTATLRGSVDPNGGVAAYQFEVSDSGADGDWSPVGPKVYAAGTGSIDVTAAAVALQPNTWYRVRLVATKQTGLNSSSVVSTTELNFLTDATGPDATTLGSANRTDTSAQLRGSVDPNGSATSYRFEYGTEEGGSFDHVVPVPDGSAGDGNTPEMLIHQIDGLLPSTTYRYRIVATNASGADTGDAVSFTTEAAPGAQQSLDDRAYELVSPADKIGGVGLGNWEGSPGVVGEMGFAAYDGERFAAQGTQGSMLLNGAQAFANDWAFAERIDGQLGWQSHSPFTHPGTASQFARFALIHAATDDLSKVMWRSNNATLGVFDFPASLVQPFVSLNPSFIGGWDGRWEIFGPTEADQLPGVVPVLQRTCDSTFSRSGSHALCSTATVDGRSVLSGLAGPGDPTSATFPDLVAGRSIYMADVTGQLADDFLGTGQRTLVNVCADGTEIPSVEGGDLQAQACSDPLPGRDARLTSSRGATAVAGNVDAPGLRGSLDNAASGSGSRVFFMSPDPQASGVPNGTTAFCSGTGDVTLCPPQLFVRQRNGDGTLTTRWISKAADGLFGLQDSALAGAVRFEGATDDGDKVFFKTNSPLTEDDPNGTGGPALPGGVKTGAASNNSWDLYLYDFPDDSGADPGSGELTRVSAAPGGGECATQPANSLVDVTGGLRHASKDGSVAYFTCSAPLAGVAPPGDGTTTAPAGSVTTSDATNLYVYDAKRPAATRIRFVARLPRGSGANNDADSCASSGVNPPAPLDGNAFSDFDNSSDCVHGTLDGEFVTFWTRGRLTADDPDSVTSDIYAYDNRADELTRVTAPQGGLGGSYLCGPATPCYGDTGFDLREDVKRSPKPTLGLATDPAIDGDKIAFFQSRSRLVPGDTDTLYDVYQWRNGKLSLVTPGSSGTTGHFLKGNDRTGRNVYFATRDRLTWQDVDSVFDVYTARVGGGIPQPSTVPICEVLLDGCQPAGVPTGPAPQVDSTDSGGSDAAPHARRTLVVSAPSAKARRRAARSGVLRLRVKGSAAGQARAVAKGRIGRRVRRVGADSTRLPGAGKSAVVRLGLSSAARRQLRAGRALRLTIRVTLTDARARTLTVRLPGASR